MTIVVKNMTKEDVEKMLTEHRELNPDRPIREGIKESLYNYAYHGYELGGFLTAVVENDLFKALGNADSYNRATIYQITSYIYNELPSTCWGSPEVVSAHYKSFEKK